jgi:translation initiation factor 4A
MNNTREDKDIDDNENQYTKWDEIPNMSDQLLRGIFNYGFERPSPIQRKGIIPIIEGKDIIAQAQSGTGKTGCFSVATLASINPDMKHTQAIILAPTRELARQIYSVVSSICMYMEGCNVQLLVGGTSTDSDVNKLKNDVPHIIVGCPGRVHDMLRRRHINSQHIKLLILDEADEMLSSGFKEQVYFVFQCLKNDIQVGLFSATLPADLISLTNKFMRDPVRILVKSEQLTLEGIKQYYIALDADGDKYETLCDLYNSLSMAQCIIYCNSVRRVSDLYQAMLEDKFPVCCIHSGMDKEERMKSYNEFREGKFKVLISSNVTARGIDIQAVSTVVNFDMPKDIHTYLHRIGRSGRWGRKGVGINFVTLRDYRKMKDIERYYDTHIEELPESFVTGN